jgi:hypothetical protein
VAPRDNPFAPSARAERAQQMLEWAEREFPEPFEETRDARRSLVMDAVRGAVQNLPAKDLPKALGELLGLVAADSLVDAAQAEGMRLDEAALEEFLDQLRRTVEVRHFGEY